MTITYTIGEYTQSDSSVEVIYTNDEGLEHRRHINIPKNPDGSIDEEYFEEILEGQLRGVENKLRVGAVTFVDPTPDEPPAPAPAPAPEEEV
jgi:hypothetical protein